jgi:hypothetical protein
VFPPSIEGKDLDWCILFIELRERRQLDTTVQVATSVVKVIFDLGIFRCFLSVNIGDTSEVLAREHFLCHILTEFHHLLSDVPEEGVAGPLPNKYDHEDWTFAKVHCHGHAQFNQMHADILFLMPSLNSPMAATVSLNALIMWVDVTCLMMPLLEKIEVGEFGVDPRYFLILSTMAAVALTGHRVVSAEAMSVTVSIFFFCCSKVIAMQLANSS